MMKKVLSILMATVLLIISGCQKYDDSSLRNDVDDLKNRVVALEKWAATVNSNITALQGIVTALQNNDYVTGVTTLTAEPGGYVITFTKSGSVTISNGRDGQNGKDGKDGANGKDGKDGDNGKDGASPQIGVKQDTDGVYYWTLNGEWITADGNKLRVTGENGINGIDGQDGVDGQDGQDGVTPQIRINTDTDEWEISYDNGNSWDGTNIKATGDKGDKGDQGDAVFASSGVDNSNPDYVEFTLADGVTKIQVPKYKAIGLDFEQPAVFTAGESKDISYTTVGNVVVVKIVNITVGWKVTVNENESKFTVTAPATVNDFNKKGEATILASDDVQYTIFRIINFIADI
jgi:hypothetical protein